MYTGTCRADSHLKRKQKHCKIKFEWISNLKCFTENDRSVAPKHSTRVWVSWKGTESVRALQHFFELPTWTLIHEWTNAYSGKVFPRVDRSSKPGFGSISRVLNSGMSKLVNRKSVRSCEGFWASSECLRCSATLVGQSDGRYKGLVSDDGNIFEIIFKYVK